MVIVAGPAGSGKTSVGRALAAAIGVEFVDGDDLHPPANVEKMRSGRPLDDDDRRPWLATLRRLIDRRLAAGAPLVLAASALRRSYRAALGSGRSGVGLVWLDVPAAVLTERLAARSGHFFTPALLGSQLAAMEPPRADEGAIVVVADRPAGAVVDSIVSALGGRR